jgi:predicted RND superfamily exporter protein
MLVGVFNIISIAFIALVCGLGVDFGIQFAVRYRHERHHEGVLSTALEQAGRGVGVPLALAAAATAAGFFSVPAHHLYRGRRNWERSRAWAWSWRSCSPLRCCPLF